MILAIIQARMGSTRLPGKVLMPLNGKPVLHHVVSRVMRSKLIERVVVATTTGAEDDPIEKFCVHEGIAVYRGSRDDVLDRFYQCAVQVKADTIVRITADCPLHDATVIDYVISEFLKGSSDYTSNTLEYSYPDGLDTEVFTFSSLADAWKNARLDSEREHVTPYIRNNPAFRKTNVVSSKRYPPYRMTLDTPEDLEFISRMYSGMQTDDFGLDDAVQYLEEHPELNRINQHHGLNEGYIKSLVQDAKKEIIQINRVYLRHLIPADASIQYLGWLRDHEVNRFLVTKDSTFDELKQYLNEKNEREDCLFYGIFLKEGDLHIGNVKLEPIDFSKKEAIIGILIGDKRFWGKGICREVIRAMVEYSFSRIYLERISLGVIASNTPAISCYLKAGFGIDNSEPLMSVDTKNDSRKIIMSICNNQKKSGDEQ